MVSVAPASRRLFAFLGNSDIAGKMPALLERAYALTSQSDAFQPATSNDRRQ